MTTTSALADPWTELFLAFDGGTLPPLSRVRAALDLSAAQLGEPGVLAELVTMLPIEGKAFRDRYPALSVGRGALLGPLEAWFSHNDRDGLSPEDRLVVGLVGFLLLTMRGLEESENLQGSRSSPDHDRDSCERSCGRLIAAASVRDVINLVYGAAAGDDGGHWQELNRKTMAFHQHGSTSIIVRVQELRDRTVRALKLVLAPFVRIPEIRTATRMYKSQYGLPHSTDRPVAYNHIIDIYASSDSWILMEFVAGQTLAEDLDQRRNRRPAAIQPSGLGAQLKRLATRLRLDGLVAGLKRAATSEDTIQLDDMRTYGIGLWRALEQNWAAGAAAQRAGTVRPVAHGDLSPSNVIVRDNGDCVLVDYGPNYLYSRAAGMAGGIESVYVAPEVRDNKPNTDLADVYSLGQLMILVGGFAPRHQGVVPDEFYMWHPSIARLLEDYLDADPDHRLDYAGHTRGGDLASELSRFRAQFTFEVDMAIEVQRDPGPIASTLPRLVNEQRLWNGEPGRARRLLKAVNTWRQEASNRDWFRDPGFDTYVASQEQQIKRLHRWSVVVAFCTGYTSLAVAWWLLRDFYLSWGNFWLMPFQYLFLGSGNGFPGLDSLRMPGYVVPSPQHNWPARVVGLSYALLAAKAYQSIYSRISPISSRGAPGLSIWPIAAEAWMRFMPIVNTILVLWVTLVGVDYWPLATIAGQTLAFVGNVAITQFVATALARARPVVDGSSPPRLSTVPPSNNEITGKDLVDSWVPSSLLFAVVCWVVGTLIYVGKLADVWLYASMVAFLNLFLIYVVKCGLNGPKMRVALHRAAFAAERLAHRD